jgi:GNAT superfamily N-acetyltransferase
MNEQSSLFELRQMTAHDLEAAIGLSTLAGWNQTEADWLRLLSIEPNGCFVSCIGDEVKGTVTTTSYQQRFGWIGMVLVHPEVRRCGMGSALLQYGLDYLEAIGVETARLDATPLGQPVYERAGFVVEYELERWEGIVSTENIHISQIVIDAIRPEVLRDVAAFDGEIFGADRSRLLNSLYEVSPELSAVCYRDGKISGYALGRPGIRANYLGPWVAGDADTARRLAHNVLRHWIDQPVFVDINLSNSYALQVAQDLGLQPQRRLIRMYSGPNNYAGQPSMVCGIAGPEVG